MMIEDDFGELISPIHFQLGRAPDARFPDPTAYQCPVWARWEQ